MEKNMVDNGIPVEQTLLDNLGKISYMLDRAYFSRLESDYGVLPFNENYNKDEQISYVSNIRALRVNRCVFDKEEKVSDCFKNVLGLFANSEDSLALVLRRSPNQTEMFFVVKNVGQGRNENSKSNIELLADSLRGNFPGTGVEVIEEKNSGSDTETVFGFNNFEAVTVLSNVPSEKSENFVSQGIEKLLNGVIPKSNKDSYTVVFLMESSPLIEVRNILRGYEEIATAITPFAGYQFQSGKNQTDTKGEMESMTHTEGISHAVTKTHSVNVGINGSRFSSVTKSLSAGLNLEAIGSLVGTFIAGPAGGVVGGAIGKIANLSVGIAKTKGSSIGASAGYGYSWGTTDTKSSSDAKTTGTNRSISLGESESTTYTYKSYMVSDLISKLEMVIKRIDESKSTGLWKYAAYVLSTDTKTTINVANFLRSISQGDESYIEPSFTQTWAFENSNGVTAFGEIQKYLTHFCHPVFGNLVDGTLVTPAIEASTTELSNVIAFPRHSVQELPVLECSRFGREPHGLVALKNDIGLGCTYHMHQCARPETERNERGERKCEKCSNFNDNKNSSRIYINEKELTKHTFITGSTGSGKSNTVYTLLNKLCPRHNHVKNCLSTHFLIIEPAKGEYKDVFGGRDDVTTYGTNPFKFPHLLQINPFSFPDDIHVLEHIDRLVEVFNACWPMYAAMPAILREAVEKSYERVDWNLKKSKNPGRFPTFETLLSVLPGVIESSEYSADTSSDYKGALKTRVRSLTRGIHGQIFNKDIDMDINEANKKIFNKNVYVDISRIGSSETKVLIMGILILKLQEFRMSEDKNNSKKLRHITVLEEAHNLLRRTSSEQSQESSNLQGKSVEMLANAIAEMRTFGEGFVIVDQSPGLMDMSVIRNTNTKIILRLPDESDRILVGKAAGLSDLQITELSRLEVGVAAISQSDWLEPVLCKVDEFKDDISLAKRYKGVKFNWNDTENDALQQFLNTAFDVEQIKLSQDVADKIRAWCVTIEIKEAARPYIEMVLEGKSLGGEQKMVLAAAITGNRICTIPDRETAVSEVVRALIGQYDFKENDEIIRRINDLFLVYFPVNIYTDLNRLDKNHESGVK
jgi:DNA helicase HerA-like ATPase